MPITILCPGCSARITAPDKAAGRTVKCPKCQAPMTVPNPADDAGFEIVDEEPAPPPPVPVKAVAKPIAATPIKATPVTAKRKAAAIDEEEEEFDRPKSKRRRDDDDDGENDRPRRKGRKAAKKGGFPLWIPLVGGGVLLIAVAVVLFLFVFNKQDAGSGSGGGGGGGSRETGGGGGGSGNPQTGPPAGFSKITVSDFSVFLPGDVKGSFVRKGGPNGPPDPDSYVVNGGRPFEMIENAPSLHAFRRAGFTALIDISEGKKLYASGTFISRPWKYEVVSSEELQLGGKPGAKLVIKEVPDLWDDTPQNAEFFKDKNDMERARVAKEGRYAVVLIASNGEWTYLIAIESSAKMPDLGKVKIVIDSIKF